MNLIVVPISTSVGIVELLLNCPNNSRQGVDFISLCFYGCVKELIAI